MYVFTGEMRLTITCNLSCTPRMTKAVLPQKVACLYQILELAISILYFALKLVLLILSVTGANLP